MNTNKPEEVALEFTKQLITLSSGVIVLSGTFIEKIADLELLLIILLGLSWIILLVSIFCGLETISAIIKSRLDNNDNWSTGYGRTSAQLSKYCFTAGISFFVVFAIISILQKNPKATEASQIKCTCISYKCDRSK